MLPRRSLLCDCHSQLHCRSLPTQFAIGVSGRRVAGEIALALPLLNGPLRLARQEVPVHRPLTASPRFRPRSLASAFVSSLSIALAAMTALAGCNSHRLAEPTPALSAIQKRRFVQDANRKLDLLFMVDDSPSMAPLQAKLSQQLGNFMDVLTSPVTGKLPDLHVAVVSSSFGGGAWSNVNQCGSDGYPGDDGGKFQQGPGGAGHGSCTMLHAGQKFLASGDGSPGSAPNYDGDIRDAFQCMALLGDHGCGFESQFESVYYALYKAAQPDDPDNGGFLRDDATLAVIMVTNEDDCSVAPQSLLLDPGVNAVSDPSGLGALQSYRCNEFGHLCNGAPPPHDAPAGPLTLNGCVSAENDGKTDASLRDPDGNPDPTGGHLWPTVSDLTKLILGLKKNPDDILVAAIAGPTADDAGRSLYRVIAQPNPSANGEIDPVVDHSCTQQTSDGSMPEYADPAVRIKQWVDGFGPNGVFYPICANDFRQAMVGIASAILPHIEPSCINGDVAWIDPKNPALGHDCQVTLTAQGGKPRPLPECTPLPSGAVKSTPTNAPCYQLIPGSSGCGWNPEATIAVVICNDASCDPSLNGSTSTDATVDCALQ